MEQYLNDFRNLTVSRGKKHKFLGMDIEFLAHGKLSLFIKDYIEKSIDLFGEEISTKVSSPEKKGLQNVDDSSKRLEKKYADIFHSMVTKLLWLVKRGKPDIEPAISFLCIRVTKGIREDKAKLRQFLQYIKHTIYDRIIMGADSLSMVCS